MSVYTVHEPPLRGAAAQDVERFAFVRDGFSFWAFAFAPLWMLRHRMWLVLAGYVAVSAALGILVGMFGASASIGGLMSVLIALLIGLEAGTLRRFTLGRRGWKTIGVVTGEDREDAERRFFDAWVRQSVARPGMPAPTPPAPSARPAIMPQTPRPPDVIGLFPEPGAGAGAGARR